MLKYKIINDFLKMLKLNVLSAFKNINIQVP